MAVNLEIVLLCVRDIAISVREGEVALRGLSRLPLHGILWGESIELLLHDLSFPGLISKRQSCAKESPSSLFDRLVEAVILAIVFGSPEDSVSITIENDTSNWTV